MPRHPNAGRKKGTPNKETRSLELKCLDAGLDFFSELIKIAKDPEHKDHFSAIKEGCQYLYPKKKALEVSGTLSQETMEKLKAFQEMPKDALLKIIQSEIKGSK